MEDVSERRCKDVEGDLRLMSDGDVFALYSLMAGEGQGEMCGDRNWLIGDGVERSPEVLSPGWLFSFPLLLYFMENSLANMGEVGVAACDPTR